MTFKQKMTFLTNCIVVITPLIFTPFFTDYFYYPKIFFVYVIALSMGGLWFLNRKDALYRETFPEKALKYYLLILILSTLFSIEPARSLWGVVNREEGLFAIVAYIFIFVVAAKHYKFSVKYINIVLLSASVVAVYGILQYFGYDPIPRDFIRINWGGRAFSTMGNPNFLGSFLTLMLPIGTFAYIWSRKSVYLLFSGILYLALLCTMTRGSWIGAVAGMMVLIVYVIRKKYSLKHLAIVLLLFASITLFMNSHSDGRILGRLLTISTDIESIMTQSPDYERAGTQRIFIWGKVIELIRDRPLLGYGLETLGTVFTDRYHDAVVDFYGRLYLIDKAHNEYLHIAVSTGIPSLLLYLAFVVSVVYKAFKSAAKNPLIIPLLSSIIGYLVLAFFNISVVSVAYVYWIFLGVLLNFSLEAEKKASIDKQPTSCDTVSSTADDPM